MTSKHERREIRQQERREHRGGHEPREKGERWIKSAISHPGALTRAVERKYGSKGFTERGTIRVSTLNTMIEGGGVNAQRARLAKRLRGMGK